MQLIYTFSGQAKDLLPVLETWIAIERTQIEYADLEFIDNNPPEINLMGIHADDAKKFLQSI